MLDGVVTRWLHQPVALGRVAWLRTVAYLFVPVDVLLTTPWVAAHDTAPASLYSPLLVGRLLDHPAPTSAWVHLVQVLLLATAVAAASGRAPRLLGGAVLVLYAEWMLIAMSYGKVDHDRFAYLVLLAVLPTVGAARHRDRAPSEAAGFAVRCVQVAVVATYVLSVAAKHRFGGGLLNWLDSAVFVRAVLRRATPVGERLLEHPELLQLGQWGLVAMELAAPVLLVLHGRRRYAALGLYLGFHLMTYAVIAIVFLPHLVAMLAFLPLERLLRTAEAGTAPSGAGRVPVQESPTAERAGPRRTPRPASRS